MPEETTNTEDGVETQVTRAPSEAYLDKDWMCDFDNARLKVREVREMADGRHEVRVCSGNPNHVKLVRT